MIAITGAAGQLGRLVIQALRAKQPDLVIVAAVRNPAKAADLAEQGIVVREADYDRPETLERAFQGVTQLLLISSSEVGKRTSQHQAVIDAAKKAGVGLLIYTSVLHADTSPLYLAQEHLATEKAIRASGVPFVFLRNGWYSENYTIQIPAILQHGAHFGSARDGRISLAARADYAEAAAVVLLSEGQANRVYELAGDQGYTLTEFAAEIAKQSGKSVAYRDLPEAEFRSALIGAGLPEGFAALLSDSDAHAAEGALFDDSRGLSKLIGHSTTPLSASIEAALRS